MVIGGVGLGLGAAFCQSLSYLATRRFVHPRGDGGGRLLLVLAHVLMGSAALVLLPFVWPAQAPPWRVLIDPLLQCTGFYLLGQMGLMVALRYAEPSRVSPMLAFKLVVLAGLTVFLGGTRLGGLQWLAILLCLGGTVWLNYSGGVSDPKAAAALIFTCVCYSLSDWNVVRLVRSAEGMETWRAFMWTTLMCYLLSGVVGVCCVPWLGSRKMKDWVDAAPFAAMWLGAALLLFACFGTVGVVYGNILQSTRGLMSVVIGSVLAQQGLSHLEGAAPRHVFARRMVAAVAMVLAVLLYRLGSQA